MGPLNLAVAQGQRFQTETLAPHLTSELSNHFLCQLGSSVAAVQYAVRPTREQKDINRLCIASD